MHQSPFVNYGWNPANADATQQVQPEQQQSIQPQLLQQQMFAAHLDQAFINAPVSHLDFSNSYNSIYTPTNSNSNRNMPTPEPSDLFSSNESEALLSPEGAFTCTAHVGF